MACHNYLIKNITVALLPTLLFAVKELLIADQWNKNGIDMKITLQENFSKNSLESTCKLIACHNWLFKTNNYVFC